LEQAAQLLEGAMLNHSYVSFGFSDRLRDVSIFEVLEKPHRKHLLLFWPQENHGVANALAFQPGLRNAFHPLLGSRLWQIGLQ
jgi:hypothetical protein